MKAIRYSQEDSRNIGNTGVCGCISRIKESDGDIGVCFYATALFSPLFLLYQIHYAFALFQYITSPEVMTAQQPIDRSLGLVFVLHLDVD